MAVFPGVLLAFLFLAGGDDRGTAPPKFAFFEPVSPPRAIEVMAHRGAMRCAPENTARALEISIATLRRDLTMARAWLYRAIRHSGEDRPLREG